MGTEKSGNLLNGFLAQVLREHKANQRFTFEQLSALSGMSIRQLKRVINDERVMNTDDMEAISRALGVSQAAVVREALTRMEKHDGI